jgi:hypothetical protein
MSPFSHTLQPIAPIDQLSLATLMKKTSDIWRQHIRNRPYRRNILRRAQSKLREGLRNVCTQRPYVYTNKRVRRPLLRECARDCTHGGSQRMPIRSHCRHAPGDA